MKEPLYVFSHQRACKAFWAKQPDGFLPTALSANEFYNQISYIPSLVKIPKSVRRLLLANAIERVLEDLPSEKDEHLLVFKRSFLGYLESSNFVGHFFNELAKFDLDIHQIQDRDIYGDFTHHLEVLERIYKHYTTQLKDLGFYDPILRLKPKLVPPVLQRFSRVEFYLGGSLNLYEQELLFAVSALVPVFLHVRVDRYNKDFLNFLKLDLKEDFSYKIDLQALQEGRDALIQSAHKPLRTENIRIHHFNSRLEQVGLALAKVQEWLEAGLEPSKLAIITPDSSLTAHLHLLDTQRNLNFAFGQNVKWAYQAYFEALKHLQANPDTPPLEDLNAQCEALMAALKASQALQDFHQEFYNTHAKVKALLPHYTFDNWRELYTRALEEQRVDDTTGGQVKVLDVLECRGLDFDRVVILDFTDQLVPNLADHDLFLNSKIRANLNIPTLKNKQNLQKHYYYQILKNSQEIDIAYHSAHNATHSKMLLELGLEGQIVQGAFNLFPPERKHPYQEDTCTALIPPNFIFSATRLNDFLACPRRFYLKYLQHYTPPESKNASTGIFLHKLLKTHYEQHPTTPVTAATLLDLAKTDHPKWQQMSALEQFSFEVIVDKMQSFFDKECTRLQQCQVVACEKKFTFSLAGFTLTGQIDRIDKFNDGSCALLDYKFKASKELKADTLESVKESQDFQLSLYALAVAAELGHASLQASFYSLKDAELITETTEVLQAKQERLIQILESFKRPIDFVKNAHKKNCQYCAYQDICGVEYQERKGY
ncbi:PD-(D/E)XK nuclease family protein [Helicobacter ailurogastricus]|uniref:PD-(D/E)XK nuclease family protein n=1 Tax=Helicobacter ailurogastricus TaxID=1578720 RepID=UPI0022C285AF|nr:PD-(D/E)XK nuclease family protein [Helicobacter ailurogastricus]GLH58222.1 PDDEXK_1 domain-containing protein/Exonuclease [Helicobacter ailurogastricus]GLH59837.1 PDDEXK_1 domain-containing protein/Exonuclease [Helicobacter ailurogastricus]